MIEATIIVPTRNRAPSLARALASFAGQDFPAERYEILVVDNGSTDETPDVAKAAAVKHPRHGIRYLHEPVPGLLSGRHRGALEARGKILCFVDDDIEAAPCWLASIVAAFADPGVHLVGGPCMPAFEVAPPPWTEAYWVRTGQRIECSALSLIYMGDETRRVDPDYIWGLNYAIRKATLYAAGGFHPDCIPKEIQRFQGDGESGLSLKLKQMGYHAVYVPDARVIHHIPRQRLTVAYFEQRWFYQGVCESYTQIRRNRSLAECRFRPYPRLFDAQADGSTYGQYREVIDQRLNEAHRAGFDFHQQAVAADPALLAWVLRRDYFDWRLPAVAGETRDLEGRMGRQTTAGVETARVLRPEAEKTLTPKIARQLEDFAASGPEHRQSAMERSGRPGENLAYFLGLRDRLAAAGVPVIDTEVDQADFDGWRSRFPGIAAFYRPAGDVFVEKCLEHYLVLRHLNLGVGDIYIDVAAAESPWAEALAGQGVRAHRLDLNYQQGIHGIDIGADACDCGLPDGFATALSLQCAFECFMGDSDTRFIQEAGRILAPGGRLAIVPLYLEDTHFITTSPLVDQDRICIDPGARRVWRDDRYPEPFARMYSPVAFLERIWHRLPADLEAQILFFTNLDELMRHYRGQRIYCFFMLLAKKVSGITALPSDLTRGDK